MQQPILLEPNTNGNRMRKAVELYQVIIGLIGLLIAIWGAAEMYSAKFEAKAAANATQVENHEQRIKQLEADRNEFKSDIKDIKSTQYQILLLIKDKQDRK